MSSVVRGRWKLVINASIERTGRPGVMKMSVAPDQGWTWPVSSQALSMGRWTALVAYGLVPWVVHLLRRIAGIDTRDHHEGDEGVETDRRPDALNLRRRVAQLSLVMAIALAVAPAAAVVLVAVGVVLALATLLCGGSWAATWRVLAASGASLAVAIVVNLPWVLRFVSSHAWTAVVGVAPSGARGNGVRALAEMQGRLAESARLVASLETRVAEQAGVLDERTATIEARDRRLMEEADALATLERELAEQGSPIDLALPYTAAGVVEALRGRPGLKVSYDDDLIRVHGFAAPEVAGQLTRLATPDSPTSARRERRGERKR